MDGIYPGIGPVLPIMPSKDLLSDSGGAKDLPIDHLPLPASGAQPDDSENKHDTLQPNLPGPNKGAPTAGQAGGEKAAPSILEEAYTLILSSGKNALPAPDIVKQMLSDRSDGKATLIDIISLPEDSLLPDESANKPDALKPEQPGHKNAAPTAGQTGEGKTAQRILDEAYTLILDGGKNAPPAPDVSKQVWQMSNYDRFGRSTAPQAAAPDPGMTAAKPNNTVANPQLLSQLSEMLSDIQAPFNMRQKDIPTPPTGNAPPAEPAKEGMAHTVKIMNPVSADDIINTSRMNKANPAENAVVSYPPAPKAAGPAPAKPDQAIPASFAPPEQISAIPKQAEEVARMLRSRMPAMPAAEQGDNGEPSNQLNLLPMRNPRPAPDVERAVYNPTPIDHSGNLANLEKISQLPYALYVFGHIPPKPFGGLEGGEVPLILYHSMEAAAASSSLFLRLSEAIKMACVLHDLYYGGSGLFEEDVPWYRAYVRYAVGYGIIYADDFTNYNDFATRAEAAYIFSNCVPRAEFPVINDITQLPDVDENIKFSDSIYLLYSAGVLTGNDGVGNFYPRSLLTRSEAASIIGRIATPADRKLLDF